VGFAFGLKQDARDQESGQDEKQVNARPAVGPDLHQMQCRKVLAYMMEHDGKNGETTQDIKLRKIAGKLHGARITDDSCLNQSVSSTIE
jgi:hypothetical protein